MFINLTTWNRSKSANMFFYNAVRQFFVRSEKKKHTAHSNTTYLCTCVLCIRFTKLKKNNASNCCKSLWIVGDKQLVAQLTLPEIIRVAFPQGGWTAATNIQQQIVLKNCWNASSFCRTQYIVGEVLLRVSCIAFLCVMCWIIGFVLSVPCCCCVVRSGVAVMWYLFM